jgi:hypothetical protein
LEGGATETFRSNGPNSPLFSAAEEDRIRADTRKNVVEEFLLKDREKENVSPTRCDRWRN